MKMNKKKAEEFIKFIAQIAKQNPEINYESKKDCDALYHHLVQLSVNENENKTDLKSSGFFENWINYFKNKDHIKVFVNEKWNYFCQFTNDFGYPHDYIKIYIPTDYNHIYKTGVLLFDFLNKENIIHHSKIAQNIRFDNIVVRVNNRNDADKVLNFVNSNKYIQEGLLEPNPFAFTKNNLAIVSDGQSSYNSIISAYLGMYIQDRKNKNQLDNVSFNDFVGFMKNSYEEMFVKKQNFDKYSRYFKLDFNQKENFKMMNRVINIKSVSELFFKSCQNSFDYSDLINHYNQWNNGSYLSSEINKFKQVKDDNNELLNEYFTIMTRKYDKELAVKNIIYYIQSGDVNRITRDNNLRERVYVSSLRDKLNTFFKNNGYDYAKMYNYFLSYSTSNTVNVINKNVTDLLNDYFEIMIEKYGIGNAVDGLLAYLENGDITGITRNNDLRARINSSTIRKDLNDFFTNCNYNRENINIYLLNYAKRVLSNQKTINTGGKKIS